MTAATAVTADRSGLRSGQRWLVAALLPIGPAAVALLRFVLPYDTVDDAATIVRKVSADPGAQSLVLWLGLVAVLTLVPAVLAAGRLTRDGAPRLTAAALLLLVPGYLALGWITAGDALLWAGAHAGVDEPTLTLLYESAHPTLAIAEILFVFGHVVGTVLLGVAMWRSAAVPRWAAVATAVSQPLHFVAAIVLVSHPLDLVAWGLNAAGFAAVALALLRLPDRAAPRTLGV